MTDREVLALAVALVGPSVLLILAVVVVLVWEWWRGWRARRGGFHRASQSRQAAARPAIRSNGHRKPL